MQRILRTEQAKADLLHIFLNKAAYSVDFAERLLQELDERISYLQTLPKIGKKRDDLAKGLRAFIVGDYIIFYSHRPDVLIVERVLPQQMDINEIIGRL